MFYKKFTTLAITAVIASLLLIGFAVKSDAASVTSMSIYSGDDSGSGTTVSVSLTTDENIDFIDWHIDGEYSFTSTHGDTQSVYVYLGTYVGNIKGIKYDVRGVVSFEESSDADASDTFRVYKPIVTSGPGSNTGASGSAYVSSLSFDGSSITMSGSAYAYNDTNNDLRVAAWFRQQKFHTVNGEAGGLDGLPRRDPHIDDPIVFVDLPPNQTFSDSVDSSMTKFTIGRRIRRGEIFFYDAHTHLQVTGQINGQHEEDHWEADSGVQGFTFDDNP